MESASPLVQTTPLISSLMAPSASNAMPNARPVVALKLITVTHALIKKSLTLLLKTPSTALPLVELASMLTALIAEVSLNSTIISLRYKL